ncbi:hypothetical protein PQQ96_25700 [Paraburkholderia sediminicola]
MNRKISEDRWSALCEAFHKADLETLGLDGIEHNRSQKPSADGRYLGR